MDSLLEEDGFELLEPRYRIRRRDHLAASIFARRSATYNAAACLRIYQILPTTTLAIHQLANRQGRCGRLVATAGAALEAVPGPSI